MTKKEELASQLLEAIKKDRNPTQFWVNVGQSLEYVLSGPKNKQGRPKSKVKAGKKLKALAPKPTTTLKEDFKKAKERSAVVTGSVQEGADQIPPATEGTEVKDLND